MATAKLVIKKSYVKKTGVTPIYIQYLFNTESKVLIRTGFEISPEHWNPLTQSLKEKAGDLYCKNYSVINAELSILLANFKSFIATAIKRKIPPTIKYVNDHFNEYLVKKDETTKEVPEKLVTLYDHIKDYIMLKKPNVAVDTTKDYWALIKHLKQYEKARNIKLDFSSFDYLFYEDFVNFLYYETLKPDGGKGLVTNGVGKQIKNLKAFLRDRMRKNYCATIDLSSYKGLSEEVDRIYLSWDEISMIYRLDLANYPELIPARDLLVLGCLLGLRFSDLSRITPDNMIDGFLRIRQKKVRKIVQIPILNETEEILKKYNWYSPKLNLYEFNRLLKDLGKVAGLHSSFEMTYYKHGREYVVRKKKYELLASHVCRRSFCTNEYLAGTDIHLIMRISGHKTERAFLTYLKMDEVVASRKIAEQWKNRKLA